MLNQIQGLVGILFRNECGHSVNVKDHLGNKMTNKHKRVDAWNARCFSKNPFHLNWIFSGLHLVLKQQ